MNLLRRKDMSLLIVGAPADTHVDAADEHDGAGKKAPEKQVEFGSLRLV